MDTRNSAMVVGLYLFGAVVVAGVMYYAYQRTVEVSQAETAMNDQIDVDAPTARVTPVPYRSTFAATNRPTPDLRASLAVTRDQLKRRTLDLNRKDAECQALKAELDESFALILGLLAEQPTGRSKSSQSKLESELTRLQQAIAKSEAMSFQLEQELAELQAEVMQSNLDLMSTQEEARREIESLTTDRQTVDSAAMQVIERMGAAAIPAISEFLVDESPSVRKWAAQCLGRIGAEAVEAQTYLYYLLRDPDPTVRAEAKIALTAITGLEID